MNTRVLFPLAGLIAGAVTALAFRDKPQPREEVPHKTDAAPPTEKKVAELAAQWAGAGAGAGAVAAYESLASVPVARLLALLESLQPGPTFYLRPNAEQQEALREAIVQRLVERDPVALAAWLARIPGGWMNRNWTGLTARTLLEAGTPAAKTALARLVKAHPAVANSEAAWLAEHDPAAALAKLMADDKVHMESEVAKWVARDPARALRMANEHPAHATALANAVGVQGRAALEQFLAGLTDPDAKKLSQQAMFYVLAREGDVPAFAALLRSQGDLDGSNEHVLTSLARLNPNAAEAVVRQLADKPGLCGKMLAAIAAEDPARAAALFNEPEFAAGAKRELLQSMLPEITQSWLLSDPAAAKAWLTALPPDSRAQALIQRSEWSQSLSTAEWVELSTGLPLSGPSNYQFAAQAVAKLKDPAALAEWCASFPGENGEKLRQEVCSRLAASDLQQATALAFLDSTPEQAREMVAAIAGRIRDKKPGEALAWVASLPPEYQFKSFEGLVPGMLRHTEAVPEMLAAVQQRIAAEPRETVEKYNDLAARAAESLMFSDRTACGNFLASLPEAVRGPAIEQVHYYCINEGFAPETMAATLVWIAQLPDAGVRRALATRICQTVKDYPEQQQPIQQALERFTK